MKLSPTIERTTLAVYILLVLIMGLATFMEQAYGRGYVAMHIYGTVWFSLLWGILLFLSSWIIIRAYLWTRLPVFLLHAAFGVILAGAAVTHFTGKEGTIHLRQGIPSSHYMAQGSGLATPLPFALQLDSFHVVPYPGTETPADFVSHLNAGVVSMNHPLRRAGYRFYQLSFDPDHQGTTLQVTFDPWGTPLTYFGYALLAVSMCLILIFRHSKTILRHKKTLTPKRFATLSCLFLLATLATARSIPAPNAEKAMQAGRMPVLYNGRIAPLNTLARNTVQKIYGHDKYKGLCAEQVILGWTARPEIWKDEPMLRVPDRNLRRHLGVQGTHATFAQLFTPDGTYRLGQLAPSKEVRELDERVGLILMLTNGTLLQPAPSDVHYSRARFEAELFYNRVPFNKLAFILSFLLAALLLMRRAFRDTRCTRQLTPCGLITSLIPRFEVHALWIIYILLMLFTLLGYVLRWYIGGRIPLGNGSETMQFLGVCSLLSPFVLHPPWYKRVTRPDFLLTAETVGALLVAGCALLVSWLGERSPQITSLMPVLNSPLLSLHVSVIMVAYTLLALLAANSILALLRPGRRALLRQRSERLLMPAVFLLAAGIFLGAVWANTSWGRYWGWDPKEVWALITLMVYALPLHVRLLPFLRRDLSYHFFLVFAFLTVLMTYFGVNYFLGGMHSYA